MAVGQVQGEATLTLPDGTVYIGTVKRGVPDGRGYFRDPDGVQYEGWGHDGRREGLNSSPSTKNIIDNLYYISCKVQYLTEIRFGCCNAL